jgi:D-alanine-D-alanine ligase
MTPSPPASSETLDVGIAFDLRSDFAAEPGAPVDRLEEYDSPETVRAIEEVLRARGHVPRRLGGGRRFVEAVLARPPDLVFNIAEGWGTRSREAHVPAVCEMLGVPFTHSDPLTLALTLDKGLTKRVLQSHGIATPRFAVVDSVDDLDGVDLPFPLFVKPACEGSSMGIRRSSRVLDARALEAQVARTLVDYAQSVLVEAFLPGVELTVAVVGNGDDAEVLGVMEIEPRAGTPEDFVYGLETKRNYAAEVAYHVPPRNVPEATVRDVERLALSVHRALGCRDVCRVDVRLDAGGVPHVLEVNALPGLSPVTSDIVILSRAAGRTYDGLIGRIVEEALARRPRGTPP